jgi:DNA polymerase-3 subunit alpha
MSEFIHLHNHSHYSLLDGAATIEGLVQAAVQHNMPAVALTDHGVMFGAIEFYKTAKKANIKPIIGCEMYIVTKGSRFEKEINQKVQSSGQGRGIYHHLVLLAKNLTGYKNLVKLSTLAHTEGFYYKPRIDMELLKTYSEGLVALSACPAGVVSFHLVNKNYDNAKETALTFKELFGDDFYLEIQNHGIAKEKPILEGMPKLAKELGIKLIATNDIHYIKQEHALAHNVMLMIPDASATTMTDYRNLRYQTDQIYFKSAEEMCELFKEYPEAIDATVEVAEKIESYQISPTKPFMPNFPIPSDAGTKSLEEYLSKLAHEGLARRFPAITKELEDRLNHELSVINKMGYAGYFLITHDFIRAAKKMGIRIGPGRGSAAGSLVSYVLEITDVNPLKYDLLFERFLNPDRVSMPDIDIDFADDKREKVIEYVKQKYGADSVSQIITFGTLSSRAVLKDVGRVIGVPLSTTESITKLIPVVQGKVTPLAEALDTVPELKWVKESNDPKIRELIEISEVLEGMNRNASTHAAGIVIAPGPISDYVPLFKTPQTELMTQYNMVDLEEAGLLKMDFLGLRTLTVIDGALALIKQHRGIELQLETIPEDDALTFELFSKGNTVGVFQFESTGMQEWLRKLRPTSISDLVAMNALYRPGPMEMIGDFIRRKHGGETITYLHPALEPILKETYGIIVYQEQVIKIASEVAGFTLAKADLMRRAMGKKDKELMAKQKAEFINGAVAKGFSKKVAGDIFDMIEKFASYGFNKSHSVAYSIVAYQTAYLKAHYPAEYMSAMMTAEIGDSEYIVRLIDECKKMNIQVLPPDVNESEVIFTVTDNGIRFGLSAIKNVGVSAVETIIQARKEGGRFKNLFDFCARVDLRLVNKKTLEALIQSGACDSLGGYRSQLFAAIELALSYGQKVQSHKAVGQETLFIGSHTSLQDEPTPLLPNIPPWSDVEKLAREKSVLGFYFSGHPLAKYTREIHAFSTATFRNSPEVNNGDIVRVCGIISSIRKKVDKKGNMMAFLTLEDFSGKGDCIVFSSAYREYQDLLKEDAMVMIVGKAEQTGDSLRVFANEIHRLENIREKFTKKILLTIPLEEVTEDTIISLRQVAQKNPGKCHCYFNVVTADGNQTARFNAMKYEVQPTDEFLRSVEELLGKDAVRLLN